MVVCYLAVVNDALRKNKPAFLQKRLCKSSIFFQFRKPLHRMPYFPFHVIAQIAAVRPWVCNRFAFFVKILCDIQCLFGGKSEFPVAVPLQLRQIIEQWRRCAFFFLFHFFNQRGLPLHPRGNFFCRFFLRDTGVFFFIYPCSPEIPEIRLQFKIVLRHEGVNFILPLHNDCQRWRLHPPNAQKRVILRSIRSCSIHAN